TTLNQRPDRLTGEPWVRCPPAARLSPMNVSPGCISAMNTSALADAPECGCTFANEQPNSLVTRSIATLSAISGSVSASEAVKKPSPAALELYDTDMVAPGGEKGYFRR